MSKKAIFIGPPGTGKTTLRKIFFEGESASKLLDYALEPTFGEESLIFDLFNEKIGIFDLAGQENERWLESDDKSIFTDASVVLIVMEINTLVDEIEAFVKKIVQIQDEIAPKSNIFLLIHKIDLMQLIDVNAKKRKLRALLEETALKKIYFTSIKSPFFTQTFSYFIDIIKQITDKTISNKVIESDFLNEIIRLLYYLHQEIVLSKEDMLLKLNLTETVIDNIIDYLINKNQIKMKYIGNKTVFSLTEEGKTNFNFIKDHFPLDNIYKFENDTIIPEFPTKKEIPLFIGCFIADKNGKTFLRTEIYNGALESFLREESSDDLESNPFDIELIPMFISALEKFSQEVNIQNLSGFDLKGINLKMKIFNFDSFTVTFFTRASLNFKSIEYKIKKFFLNIFHKYKKEFISFQNTGHTAKDTDLSQKVKQWLLKLNESYTKKIKNVESYGIEQSQELYKELDELQNKLDLTFSILSEKIKTLKINLTKAILDNNLEHIQQIAQISQDFMLRYYEYTDVNINEEISSINKKYPKKAIEAYRNTGGIPIRKGKLTKTFKKWYFTQNKHL
ncbi:MAG: hypothetical protein BAJALOKI1v1_30009 [Promethearchaeota archaeon]|nr:MAG: hypothetical protein BAJALOKI1v1_30009 [Candidatus Lokiarchaeota archaeon]